jgi:hypothetical protein
MNRKTIVSFVCAAIALVLSAPAGFAQQSAQLPKLNPFRTPTKDRARQREHRWRPHWKAGERRLV